MIASHAPSKPLLPLRRGVGRALVLAGLALGLVLAAGCGSYKSPGEKLRDAAWRFNESVRWGRFSVAAKALPPTRRGPWLKAMERTAGALRVLEFDMTPVRVGSKRALVQVDLSYVRASDPVVRQQRRQQLWRYDDGHWMLEADREVQLAAPKASGPPARLPDFVAGDARAGAGSTPAPDASSAPPTGPPTAPPTAEDAVQP